MSYLFVLHRCWQHTDSANLADGNKNKNAVGVNHFIRQKCIVTRDDICEVGIVHVRLMKDTVLHYCHALYRENLHPISGHF